MTNTSTIDAALSGLKAKATVDAMKFNGNYRRLVFMIANDDEITSHQTKLLAVSMDHLGFDAARLASDVAIVQQVRAFDVVEHKAKLKRLEKEGFEARQQLDEIEFNTIRKLRGIIANTASMTASLCTEQARINQLRRDNPALFDSENSND